MCLGFIIPKRDLIDSPSIRLVPVSSIAMLAVASFTHTPARVTESTHRVLLCPYGLCLQSMQGPSTLPFTPSQLVHVIS